MFCTLSISRPFLNCSILKVLLKRSGPEHREFHTVFFGCLQDARLQVHREPR